MTQAKKGDTVKVHYTGTLKDGSEFDSSRDRDPLEFIIGEQQVIEGFEQAVVGMSPGDSVEVTIVSEQAYGPRVDDMIATVSIDQFPSDFTPVIGQQLQLRKEDGTALIVLITDINDATVTLDANHPLAGEDLTFSIELVEIVE